MWPYCGHFQVHRLFGLLDQIGIRLIYLAIVDCEACNFKTQNWRLYVEVVRKSNVKVLIHLN